MSSATAARPAKLYRYLPRELAERALAKGEFRLMPSKPQQDASAILPFASAKAAPAFLTLGWSTSFDARLFDDFPGADCCLVVSDTEALGERIHRAVARILPDWAGIDASVSYGVPSPLGAAFSRDRSLNRQKEWLFAWRPRLTTLAVKPVVIELGSLAQIAQIQARE